MLASLPSFLRVPLALLALALNIGLHIVFIFVFTLFKLIVPVRAFRQACSRALVAVAESWIGVNNMLFGVFTRMRWQVDGLAGLRRDGNYLVLCNHQSWVDIPVLQKVFNRRIPFLRFFLRAGVDLGAAARAGVVGAGFSLHEALLPPDPAAPPRTAGQGSRGDATRLREIPSHAGVGDELCRGHPLHAGQARRAALAARYLLRPKAGGVAFVLDAMGEALHAILDVTIVYPSGPCTIADLIAGRVREVRVHVRERPLQRELIGSYDENAAFRGRVKAWMNTLWSKDTQAARMQLAPGADSTGE
ncbi:1-acyl-sn-glycerol-3-phosphate acyltransferase [Rhodanobacter lindaniclasticus]